MRLSERPAICLEELVAQAELLTRIDRKYVVDRRDVADLMAAAPGDARVLEIDGRRRFGYRSVYLDTPGMAAYRLAGQRRRRRFKVRTRAYLDTGTCWLEVKTRSAREATVKERIEHPDAEPAGLTARGRCFVADRLAAARVVGVDPDQLAPVLATAYDRTTLLLPDPDGASRVTVDTELGWTSLGPRRRDLDRPGLAIIETKTGSTPSAMDRTLWARGHRPVRISKYGAGLAALRDDLPDLKWHRVVGRHLDHAA